MVPQSFSAGEVLRGKYRVERVLGAGGMSIVLLARHLRLDQQVAIKVLNPDHLARPEAVRRFAREARAAARLRGEHVVRVLDVDESAAGAPFMVMEYLQGRDLREVLRAKGPLGVRVAVDYALQACEGLAEAHSLGIVHRDVKPANLFLTTGPGEKVLKLLDFGISKTAPAPQKPGATATGLVLGSPAYMSPEQLRSPAGVDARTDIWSLGVVLYELVSGARPFQGPSATSVMAQIAADQPLPLRALRPDAPAPLEQAVARCLAKRREDRYPDIAELARALAELTPTGKALAERVARFTAPRVTEDVTIPPQARRPLEADGDTTLPSSLGRRTAELSAEKPEPSLVPAPPPQPAPRPASPRRSWLLFAATVLAAGAMTGLAILWLRGQGPPADLVSQGAPPIPLAARTLDAVGEADAAQGLHVPVLPPGPDKTTSSEDAGVVVAKPSARPGRQARPDHSHPPPSADPTELPLK
ncbi:MAG: serine/threonine protein kinase [Deltaproteobacteria bacterium]|nr:serine/threonine protein kinase [Deltaproteobacteria bacterium]